MNVKLRSPIPLVLKMWALKEPVVRGLSNRAGRSPNPLFRIMHISSMAVWVAAAPVPLEIVSYLCEWRCVVNLRRNSEVLTEGNSKNFT